MKVNTANTWLILLLLAATLLTTQEVSAFRGCKEGDGGDCVSCAPPSTTDAMARWWIAQGSVDLCPNDQFMRLI